MESYTCKRCNKVWPLNKIIESIAEYGFINLTSQHEEIIAFSCPDTHCFSLISIEGPMGIFDNFFNNIDQSDKTGPSFKKGFSYYATLPFFERIHELLGSLEAIPSHFIRGRSFKNGFARLIKEFPDQALETDYYCSYNGNYHEVLDTDSHVWWYRKKDIKRLFEIEQSHGLRIFPRYIIYSELLEKIDSFCWTHYIDLPYLQKIEDSQSLIMIYSWEKDTIARQFDFIDLLTPERYILETSDIILESNHNKSNAIWKDFHKEYIQEQLLSQSELFIRDYLEINSKTNFCFSKVIELISHYRNEISGGLISRRKKEKTQKKTLAQLANIVKKEAPAFDHIISKNEEMLLLQLNLNRLVKNNARSFPILFDGETGTGKSFLAKAIHDASGRKGRFVEVNAAAIVSSIFESELFGHKKGAFSGATSDREGLLHQWELPIPSVSMS